MNILVAEDDAINIVFYIRFLTKLGHKVTVAHNGEEAFHFSELINYDVILMDINMPYLDGYAATAIIREKEKKLGTTIPIIALTAYALNGDKEKCLQAGMNDYISKPINLRKAVNLIQQYVTQKKE